MSSCRPDVVRRADRRRVRPDTYLERLGIPVLDFLNGRHVAKIVRQLVELFDSVGETYGKFLCVRKGVSGGAATERAVAHVPRRN